MDISEILQTDLFLAKATLVFNEIQSKHRYYQSEWPNNTLAKK